MITIAIENSICKFTTENSSLVKELDTLLSYTDRAVEYSHSKNVAAISRYNGLINREPNQQIVAKYKSMLRKILFNIELLEKKRVVRLMDKKRKEFPAGLLPRVLDYLDSKGIYWDLRDERIKPNSSNGLKLINALPKLRYYQEAAAVRALEDERGILEMSTGCHAAGQQILMFDGTLKVVEEVEEGDLLMGPDSKPRKILGLCKGVGQMYRIVPRKGEPFIVNDEHILSLQKTKKSNSLLPSHREGSIVNISVKDYLLKSKNFKHLFKLYRAPVDFSNNAELPIDPYILGLWIGDGNSRGAAITTMDEAVGDAWFQYLDQEKATFRIDSQPNNRAITIFSSKGVKGKGCVIFQKLKKLNLVKNKHIPTQYLTASQEDRLSLLAGIIDTDGSLDYGGYDYVSISNRLATDVLFLSRSLGFSAYLAECTKSSQNGTNGIYYRIRISGDIDRIPVRLSRKMSVPRKQKKSVLRTGFTVEKLGVDKYYGFKVSDDNLYLLNDFTVTHNSGKTVLIAKLLSELKMNTLIVTPSVDITEGVLETMEKFFGEKQVSLLKGKKAKFSKINVVNIQALAKMPPEWFKDIHCIVTDESHHGAASTYLDVNFNHLKNCYYRFGFTATNFRNNGDDMALEAVLSHKIYHYSAKQAIKDKFLHKPEMRWVYNKTGKNSNYQKEYKEQLVENADRNQKIADLCLKHKSDHVIVLVQQVAHGELLLEQIPHAKLITGSETRDDRRKLLNDFRSGKLKCLIGTSVLGEGVDLPIANVMILAGGGKAKSQYMQNLGRIMRLCEGKKGCIAYDFRDEGSKFLSEHSKQRAAIYAETY